MESCYPLPMCHGHLGFHKWQLTEAPIWLERTKKRAVSGGKFVSGMSIRATTTLPSSSGSSRHVGYQEPLRLLEETSTSGRAASSSKPADAEYTIQLTTSNEEKAGLSMPNAGIILSLIGEEGEALVHRIFPDQENLSSGRLQFQRGSVDVIDFCGPNLGRIAALWIAPEAGTWRLEQATVTIVPSQEEHDNADPDSNSKIGLFHMFQGNDMLLGDGEELPAVELKPSFVLRCDGPNDPGLITLKTSIEPPKTREESTKLRDSSMQDYEALKIFLLGSAAAMVGAGTLGLSLLGAKDLAQGFTVGGIGGLIYLLLLQRAVDQIPSPQVESNPDNSVRNPGGSSADAQNWTESPDKISKRSGLTDPESKAYRQGSSSGMKVRTRAGSFALVVGLALVVTRATQASPVISLPPQELLAGALGFFTSKIAVLLGAFFAPKHENY